MHIKDEMYRKIDFNLNQEARLSFDSGSLAIGLDNRICLDHTSRQ